jgi:3-phenylpropionate/cinnamic acid dioxygenase small subunit
MMDEIDAHTAAQLMARYWCCYDEGEFDVLAELLDEDVAYRVRTDTGTTTFEEFVRAEATGRDQVMRWQTEHRLDSPYPLRHSLTNFHVTERDGDLLRFRHYLVVNSVKDVFPAPVPGGVVDGAMLERDGALRIAELRVTLDTMDSVPFREARPNG